jgi:hypothetical protein
LKIKLLAGISTGVSAGGTLAGGAALITGIMKNRVDLTIEKLESSNLLELYDQAANLEKQTQELATAKKKSQTLGNVRTGMLGVTTATSAASAITAGFSAKNFDELIGRMTACNKEIADLEQRKTQMQFDGMEGSEDYAKIDALIANCKKFDIKNMTAIKKQMTISGIVSAIGGATALTGTITSAVAASKEKKSATMAEAGTKGLNLAANISAGVATAASGASLILGAVALAKLNQDADNAENCEKVF